MRWSNSKAGAGSPTGPQPESTVRYGAQIATAGFGRYVELYITARSGPALVCSKADSSRTSSTRLPLVLAVD